MAQLRTGKSPHYLNVDFRDELRSSKGCEVLDISTDELIAAQACFREFGVWRFDVETQTHFWSEDMYHIHGMDYTPGRVNVKAAVAYYHPEDREYLPCMLEDAISNESGFHFSLRITARRAGYKFVSAVGKFRKRANGHREIIGTLAELPPPMRMIGAAL